MFMNGSTVQRCLSILLSSVVTPALAQQELAPISITATTNNVLYSETATGSKLGLTPMQTPASLEIIDREQLQARGDSSVINAITRATGISAAPHPGNSFSELSARGFVGSTSVMRLYDGMRLYGGDGTLPFDTWQVERIEVLRGPASVTDGNGGIGGVINVIPKKPTQAPIEHEAQITLGTDNTQRLGLGSGGAIDERFSYRLDVSGARSDGWVKRGENKNASFSGALQWQAREDLTLKFSHAYGYQEPMRYFGIPLINGRQIKALRKNNYNVSDSHIRFRDQWDELASTWTASEAVTVNARLYRLSSEYQWRNAEYYDYNPSSGLLDRTGNTQIRQQREQNGLAADAVFNGTLAGLDNRFALGLDISGSLMRHSNNLYSGTSSSVNLKHPSGGRFASDFPFIPRYQNRAQQYALFIEDRLALTEQWSVIGGLRYDHARIKRSDLVLDQHVLTRRFDNLGFRLGTVYQLTEELALYAQYAKALEPVSSLLWLSPANADFDMTEGRQVELGLKQDFWQGKGQWTLAAYQIRKTNLITRDPNNPAQSIQVGQQTSRGLEASGTVNIAHNWTIDGNASVLRARYDDFTENSGGVAVSRSGKVPPNVPQRLANLSLSWDFREDWTASITQRYVGKRYADNANRLTLPGYSTSDLALHVQLSADTRLSLHGFNVFDKAYFSTAYYSQTQWLYGEGRKFELKLHHKF